MKNFKREYKQLYKYYSKKLKKLQKLNNFSLLDNLEYFFTKLAFLRDYYYLTAPDLKNKVLCNRIDTLAVAIEEYEKYKVCMKKGADQSLPVADQIQFYNESKKYWNNVTAVVALNIGNWFNNYEFNV